MIVTQKQWNGLLLAGGLLLFLLLYSFFGLMFLMGWSWEEVARSVPSPELPPIPPAVWDAFRLVIGALALAIGLAGGGWLWQRRQPIFTPARLAAIQQQLMESEQLRQQAEQRASQAVADAMTADAQRDVAQSAMVHQSRVIEALQEARRKDHARFRAMLEKRAANAAQVRAEPMPEPPVPAEALVPLPPERAELLREMFTLDGESFMKSERRWRRFLQVLSANAVLLSYSTDEPTPLLTLDPPDPATNRLETAEEGERGSSTVEVSTVPVRSFIYLPSADELEVDDESSI